MSEQKRVVVEDVRFLLSNGYTRTTTDKNYNAEIGSIEEYYSLSPEQVRLMFRDARMKNMRFKKVAVAEFVLDEGEATITELPRMNNTTVATDEPQTNVPVEEISTTEEFETVG